MMSLRMPFTCIVRRQTEILKYLSTSAQNNAGFKRYDHRKDSIRQSGTDPDLPSDGQPPLLYDKTYGTSSFPTLETHNQIVDGIRFMDLPVVHIKSTSNNTIVALAHGDGGVIALQSSGTVGFRNAKKGTNVAAQAAAIALAGDALRKKLGTVRVCLKGIGPGRLPALKALQMSGMNVVSITDTTPLPHNGCRPKKARRL